MRLPRLLPSSLVLLAPVAAAQQGPAPAPAAIPEAPLDGGAPPVEAEAAIEGETLAPPRVLVEPSRRTGFTSGLRLGVGVPLGDAGRDAAGAARSLSDLATFRAPLWIDVGYSFGALTLGAYGQVGVGGTGDACVADCDWSDIRIGAQAELRFLPSSAVDPWLGVGLGYEWLSYRALIGTTLTDEMGVERTIPVRVAERFGGPELLLHGGVDFQPDDALRVGPFAGVSVGQYVTDSYKCTPDSALCPAGSSVDGSAFHAWISVGLRGAYTP